MWRWYDDNCKTTTIEKISIFCPSLTGRTISLHKWMHKQAVPTCRASNSNIQAHFSAMSIGISQDPLLQARSLVGVVTIRYPPEIMCGSSFKSNNQRKLKLIGSRGWKWTLEMLFSPQQLRFTTWKRVHRGNPYKSKAQCLPNCCSHRMWWFLAGFLKNRKHQTGSE